MTAPIYAALVEELGIDPAPPREPCDQPCFPVSVGPFDPLAPGRHPGICLHCGRFGKDHTVYWNRIVREALTVYAPLSGPSPRTWRYL